MSTVRIITRTCDSCGTTTTTVDSDEHACTDWPYRWASLSWDDPPGDGKKYRQYKDMSLCPGCLDKVLRFVGEEQVKPSVTDLPLSLRSSGVRFDSGWGYG